jgi:membrane associated rhomboid family serine protease
MSYYRYANSSYYRPSLFGGFKFFPPVIKSLLISNVAIFFFASFISMFHVQGSSLAPLISYIFALYPFGDGFQVWQLLTYMFMHGSLMHLLFNMLALWMFGMDLENEWGSKKFLLYYVICGLGAGLSNLFIGPLFGPAGPTVGASGAIYGVLLAFGMMYPDRPIFVYFLLPIRARYFVLLYIIIEVYAGVAGSADGVAHFAHLGGAAVGLVYMLFERGSLPMQRLWYQTKHRLVSPERVNEYSRSERGEVSDAKYFDVHDDREERVNQQRIDEILDKISQRGYQSLTEDEKKILFEASKKLN